MTWLFGEENAPPEYILEIISESGLAQAQWEHIGRQMEGIQRQGGGKQTFIRLLRAFGLPTVGATAIAGYAASKLGSIKNTNRQEGLGKRKATKEPEERFDKFHKGDTTTVEVSPNGNSQELITDEEHLGNIEFIDQFDGPMPRRNWWEETTLQDRDRAWLHQNDNMEIDNGGNEPIMEAARASNGGPGGNQVSKETPISQYPALTYGLQETHTTILPWVGWLTVAGLDKETPAQLKIRMNAPYDMLDVTTADNGSTDGAKLTTKGFYNLPLDPDGRVSGTTGTKYPAEFGNNTTTAHERPQWREYWAAIYEYYTVLGCEYEIIMYNPVVCRNTRINYIPQKTISTVVYPSVMDISDGGLYNTDIVVATQFDTYSSTAGTTGNVMPLAKYEEIRGFKNIKWTSVPGGQKAVIRGTYKPGDAKRNISNDGDVKTWTKCSDGVPSTLSEILTLNFFCDPFHNARYRDSYETAASVEPSATGSIVKGGCNMEIKLKYIVQFKDLVEQARYPNTTSTAIDRYQILSDSIADKGNPLMSWTTASTAQ